MDVHETLSTRWLSVPAVMTIVIVGVAGVFTLSETFASDYTTAAGVTLAFVVLVVATAAAVGLLGGTRRSTTYW